MTIAYSSELRTTRLQALKDQLFLGAAPCTLKLMAGTRPAIDSSTVGTALYQFAIASGAIADHVLTFADITSSYTALATGTATWFRLFNADGVKVLDGDVDTAEADLILDAVELVAGQTLTLTTFTITEGNA